MLATHVDRDPLISSAIINVDQSVTEPWPLEVYGKTCVLAWLLGNSSWIRAMWQMVNISMCAQGSNYFLILITFHLLQDMMEWLTILHWSQVK